jgi:hypothetical protein
LAEKISHAGFARRRVTFVVLNPNVFRGSIVVDTAGGTAVGLAAGYLLGAVLQALGVPVEPLKLGAHGAGLVGIFAFCITVFVRLHV